ncbi:hypothetical protein HGRIS_010254 [Hohenbuehelia grisea]|uniref:BTB domain-containing protein n=1 Tax=Hohenbuehelia grisea TaxID=104357 RepID=A0ABR3J3S0_9AGAR
MPSMRDFHPPDCDVILASGDVEPIHFHAHRFILSAASPFFKSMFSLPQKPVNETSPVVQVSETHTTLDALLQFVYPVPDPEIASLDELVPILAAASKYDLTAPISALRKILVTPQFVETEPTRVYAIACRYELAAEARLASSHTLNVNVLDCPLSEDLKHISAYAYHQLLDLHRRRSRAAQALLQAPDGIKCMQCNGTAYSVYGQPKWWFEFETRAKEELAIRPTSAVIFEMPFLFDVASSAGCVRCPGSVLESHKFLAELKQKIDALPMTI